MEDCCKDNININWVKKLPKEFCGNTIYFVKTSTGINMYVTNYQGVPFLIGGSSSGGGDITITSPNNTISIQQNDQDFELSISSQLLAKINMALQAGDNISLLNNNVGYITLADLPSLGGLQQVTDVNATTTNKVFLTGGAQVPNAVSNPDAVPLGQLTAFLANKADLVGGKVPQNQSQPSTLMYNPTNGVITLTDATGTDTQIDLPIENLFNNASYNSATQILTLTTVNGGTVNINLSTLVDLPEIVISNNSNPGVVPSTNQKLYFRSDNGSYWVSNGTAWVGPYVNLVLGETSITAYRGDRGKIAYDHSQITSGNPHGTTLQTTTDAGNSTTNAVGIGTTVSPTAFQKLVVRQIGSSGMDSASVFSGLNVGGIEFMKINDAGIQCGTYTSYGTGTVNFLGNTVTNLTYLNPNTGRLVIGTTTGGTVPLSTPKNYILVQQSIIPFAGSNNVNHNILEFNSIVNLAGQSNTGGVTRTRQIYVNPTLSNFGSNHRYSAFESVIGGVYVNTSVPQDSAILQADSTTQGFLPPRMTEAQRTAITSPTVGLLVEQTNNSVGYYVYQASGWDRLVTATEIANGNTISGAGTLTVVPTPQNSYYTFNGTTATWTLGTLASTANKFITLINMGSGAITLNTNAGGNDIWDGGSNVNTLPIPAGIVVRLYNNSLKYIILQ